MNKDSRPWPRWVVEMNSAVFTICFIMTKRVFYNHYILCKSLSRFNGHFPGELGLASFTGGKYDGDGGDN